MNVVDLLLQQASSRPEALAVRHGDEVLGYGALGRRVCSVAAGLETCRQRDPNGLYGKAMRGEIPDFTGISSPYEAPEHPEIVLDTERQSVQELVEELMEELRSRGLLSPPGTPAP